MTELENRLRIAHLHLKGANERKATRPLGNEEEIINICKKLIENFTNQINEQSKCISEQ